jgi:hypothetical protein
MHLLQLGPDEVGHFAEGHVGIEELAVGIAIHTVLVAFGAILFCAAHFQPIDGHAAALAVVCCFHGNIFFLNDEDGSGMPGQQKQGYGRLKDHLVGMAAHEPAFGDGMGMWDHDYH